MHSFICQRPEIWRTMESKQPNQMLWTKLCTSLFCIVFDSGNERIFEFLHGIQTSNKNAKQKPFNKISFFGYLVINCVVICSQIVSKSHEFHFNLNFNWQSCGLPTQQTGFDGKIVIEKKLCKWIGSISAYTYNEITVHWLWIRRCESISASSSNVKGQWSQNYFELHSDLFFFEMSCANQLVKI